MQTVTLSISGMTCGHCVQSVRGALDAVPGVDVQSVRIGAAQVMVDSLGTVDAALDAVQAAGYDASVDSAINPQADRDQAAGGAAAVQEATISVKGGYSPAVVRAEAGRPVRLRFDRQETSRCSEEVVFADLGIRRHLPAHQQTTIEVTPATPGTYEFTCGMGMLRGRLIAE